MQSCHSAHRRQCKLRCQPVTSHRLCFSRNYCMLESSAWPPQRLTSRDAAEHARAKLSSISSAVSPKRRAAIVMAAIAMVLGL